VSGIPDDAFSVLLAHTPEIKRHAAHCGFEGDVISVSPMRAARNLTTSFEDGEGDRSEDAWDALQILIIF
jgi:hypothetical protein